MKQAIIVALLLVMPATVPAPLCAQIRTTSCSYLWNKGRWMHTDMAYIIPWYCQYCESDSCNNIPVNVPSRRYSRSDTAKLPDQILYYLKSGTFYTEDN